MKLRFGEGILMQAQRLAGGHAVTSRSTGEVDAALRQFFDEFRAPADDPLLLRPAVKKPEET